MSARKCILIGFPCKMDVLSLVSEIIQFHAFHPHLMRLEGGITDLWWEKSI